MHKCKVKPTCNGGLMNEFTESDKAANTSIDTRLAIVSGHQITQREYDGSPKFLQRDYDRNLVNREVREIWDEPQGNCGGIIGTIEAENMAPNTCGCNGKVTTKDPCAGLIGGALVHCRKRTGTTSK